MNRKFTSTLPSETRQTNPEWFEAADMLHAIADDMAHKMPPVTWQDDAASRQHVYGSSLFIRCTTNFIGACIMAESGLYIESRILSRSCIESAIHLAAMTHDSGFFEKLQSEQKGSRIGQAEITAKLLASLKSNPEWEAELKEYVRLEKAESTRKEREKLNLASEAETAGRLELYAIFRILSDIAAHPSLTSLGEYFDIGTPTSVSNWGKSQDAVHVGETLFFACAGMIRACEAINILRDGFYPPEPLERLFERCEILTKQGRRQS